MSDEFHPDHHRHHHHHHHDAPPRRDEEEDYGYSGDDRLRPMPRRDDDDGYGQFNEYSGEERRHQPPRREEGVGFGFNEYSGEDRHNRPPVRPADDGYQFGGGFGEGRPRPPYAGDGGYGYDQPPPPSHQSGGYNYGSGGSDVQHVSHEVSYGVPHGTPQPADAPGRGKPTVRVFCKAGEDLSLAIRDGKVVVVDKDPSDDSQHWIKDLKYSTRVKDEEGYPAFSLVNKATGEALKHSLGQSHPVRLVPYNPEFMDESVLWTESRDVGEGFRCIRMVNNIYLNFDVFHGDKAHGGVRDGSTIVLWEWTKGDNQRWKIVPW